MIAAVGVLSACGAAEPPGLAGVVREPALEVASVSLPSIAGEDTEMMAQPGELLVVYFGYTFCPDICPATMSDISVAFGDLDAAQRERVSVAFVTVDPERDTADQLEEYLGYFFDDGLALRTEDPAVLGEAAAAFGVEFEVADHEPGARRYDVAHTAVTYVVDDEGTVGVEWPFGFAPDDMAADLDHLLNEERT